MIKGTSSVIQNIYRLLNFELSHPSPVASTCISYVSRSNTDFEDRQHRFLEIVGYN